MIGLIVATIGNKLTELARLLDSLTAQKYSDFYVIVVSQDNHEQVANVLAAYSSIDITQVRMNLRGLARARNEGMRHLKPGTFIASFPDDDCWFPPFALGKIDADFKLNPANTSICYQIYDPLSEQYYKGYKPQSIKKMDLFEILRVCSIEIFINVEVFNKLNIVFDERFGLGATYISGEENIFMADIVKANGIVTYLPEVVVYHEKSNEAVKLSDAILKGKGALFARIFGKFTGSSLLLIFMVKKLGMINVKRAVPNTIEAYKALINLKAK